MTIEATTRVTRFLEEWDQKNGSTYPTIYVLEPKDQDERALLASDLQELLDHISALQDRIDSLPDGGETCPTCGAVACACAYDGSQAVCAYHAQLERDKAEE